MNTVKPLKPPKRLSDIRVTRKSITDLNSRAEGHGWAVSYADLLMVLLSFFVIFFSLEDDPVTSKNQLRQLALSIRGIATSGSAMSEASAGAGDTALSGLGSQPVAKLAEILKVDGLSVTQEKDKVIVHLMNSAYGPGEYSLSPDLRAQVDVFYDQIRKYNGALKITIIGHTDSVPLRARNSLLMDNFDLSSIRALHTLKYLIKLGFPKELGSARAAGSFDRSSRSISFEVTLNEAGHQEGHI